MVSFQFKSPNKNTCREVVEEEEEEEEPEEVEVEEEEEEVVVVVLLSIEVRRCVEYSSCSCRCSVYCCLLFTTDSRCDVAIVIQGVVVELALELELLGSFGDTWQESSPRAML